MPTMPERYNKLIRLRIAIQELQDAYNQTGDPSFLQTKMLMESLLDNHRIMNAKAEAADFEELGKLVANGGREQFPHSVVSWFEDYQYENDVDDRLFGAD